MVRKTKALASVLALAALPFLTSFAVLLRHEPARQIALAIDADSNECPDTSAFVKDPAIYDYAKRREDPKAPRRREIPGACRSRLGPQLHPQCLRFGAGGSYTRPQMMKAFEDYLTEASRAVLDRCQTRYPELTPYLSEWATQARRTVFACVSKTQKEVDAGAMAIPNTRLLKENLSPTERAGIEELEHDRSYPMNHLPIVVLPRDNFIAWMKGDSREWTINMIIHEIFHQTSLNNREDHNDIERSSYDPKKSCFPSFPDDRINMVSHLCQGSKPHRIGDRTVESVLAERAGWCGAERACIELFTSRFESVSEDYLDSTRLPPSQAASLCTKIIARGQCEKNLERAGGGKAALYRNAQVRAAFEPIRQRLDAIFPRATNEIPIAMLRAFPSIQQRLQAEKARDPQCYKFMFGEGPDGSLYLRKGAGHSRIGSDIFRLDAPALAHSAVRNAAWSLCNDSRFIQILDDLKNQNLFYFTGGPTFEQMARKRFLGVSEETYPGSVADKVLEDYEQVFRRVIGPELVARYRAAVAVAHPESPAFDCLAAGPYYDDRAAYSEAQSSSAGAASAR